MTLPDIEITR